MRHHISHGTPREIRWSLQLARYNLESLVWNLIDAKCSVVVIDKFSTDLGTCLII